jgi:hypothetical protein
MISITLRQRFNKRETYHYNLMGEGGLVIPDDDARSETKMVSLNPVHYGCEG